MTCIREIHLRELRLPLKEPFVISSGVQEVRRIFLVELVAEDGCVGWGECVAGEEPNYLPETVDVAWHMIREWIGPTILDREIEHPRQVYPLLQEKIRGHPMAKAAVEMAVWELEARRQQRPLADLLGGTRSQVASGISIGVQPDPETLVDVVQQRLAEGYRRIKLKIKPGADVEYVEAVREAVGSEAPLMVDANNAYSVEDLDTLKALDAFDLMMIEQPLSWDDLVQHAALQRQLETPICLDESITSPARAEEMIALESGRVINIKPGRVGGFTPSMAIHDLCAQNDIPVWCGGMLESGVGRGHNVALASLPNFTITGDLSPSSRYWTEDIVNPEWVMEDGRLSVPKGEGIGVQVDRDAVDELTVRSEVLTGA